MATKTIKLVNMTSTEIFKFQAEAIYDKIRHDNTDTSEVIYRPTHMGGTFGQRDILNGDNVMRQITVRN